MKMTNAQAFTEDWVTAFNAKDLERILSHYDDEVQLISPLYAQFTGGLTDTARGLAQIREYFSTSLARYPELRFTLLEVAEGAHSLCVRYRTNLGERTAIEVFERGSTGKVSRVVCHYVGD